MRQSEIAWLTVRLLPVLFVAGALGWSSPAMAAHDIVSGQPEPWLALELDLDLQAVKEFRHVGRSDGGFSFRSQLETEFDDVRNANLDKTDDEDTYKLSVEYNLFGLYQKTERFRLLARLELAHELSRENPDSREKKTEVNLRTLYGRWFFPEVQGSVVLGRQELSDERQWLFDEDMDGVRYVWHGKDRGAQVFVGREQYFAVDLVGKHNKKKPNVFYARYYWALSQSGQASVYAAHIADRGFGDEERSLYMGARALGDLTPETNYWADGALLSGKTERRRVRAYGFDVGMTRKFKSVKSHPYVTLAMAYGSGDDRLGSDSAFRQTGLQGNSARFGGVTKLNYYGKVFNPELSNMAIFTAGVGMRPARNWSVDLVYYRYRQVKASRKLRQTDIDDKPNGVSRDLGSELALVVGLRNWRNISLEGVYGVFHPGTAFSGSRGIARHLELVLKWKF